MGRPTDKKSTAREVVTYLVVGILTTLVSLFTYFATLRIGENILRIDTVEPAFYYVRIVAEILQWIFSVVFAFFTNKKWVFTNADPNASTAKQFSVFAGSRLMTLALDAILTFGVVWLLQTANYKDISFTLILEIPLSADFIAKAVASVSVVITNYFISKFLVFKNKN